MQIQFDIQTPVDHEVLRARMIETLSLGLGDIPVGEPRRETLTVFASGPSVLTAPFSASPSLALNNSLKLFTDRGLCPTYWAACDPQELVADFIPDDPAEATTYLVASKCHPRVFEKLKGRNVLLWHVDDAGLDLLVGRQAIPTAVSITLCALNLASMMGYRTMDVHGWDGCYVDGRDHAAAQPHTASRVHVTFPNGRQYQTTATWAAEAEEAAEQLRTARYTATIHGDGLIKAMVEHVGRREAA